MERFVLNWNGPFKINDGIPKHMIGALGLYLIKCNSEITYVGKAETEGAFRRAKNHFRGVTDSIGNCILKDRNKPQINIWVAWIEEGQRVELISDAEKLLIYKLQSSCNKSYRDKYKGRSLHIINRGDYPEDLPEELQYSVC